MRLKNKAALVVLAAQVFLPTILLSADFQLIQRGYGYPIIALDGPIEKGDAVRFRAIMHEAIATPGIKRLVISLDSPGGSVDEAIKIGKIVRATLAKTWTASTTVWPRSLQGKVDHLRVKGHKQAFADLGEPLPALSKCLSACTIIFYSGVERAVFNNRDSRANESGKGEWYPTIGVHRPRYDPTAFGQLSPAEAQEAYNEMLRKMSEALAGFGAPDVFIERTMATSWTEIDLIPSDEMDRLVADTEPFFEDWLAAKCGHDTDILTDQVERELYGRYRQVLADRLKIETPAEFLAWDEDVALVEEFGLINAARAKTISEKVRGWGRWVNMCAEVTVRTVRQEWSTEAR